MNTDPSQGHLKGARPQEAQQRHLVTARSHTTVTVATLPVGIGGPVQPVLKHVERQKHVHDNHPAMVG